MGIRLMPETVEELMQFSREWGWPLNRDTAVLVYRSDRYNEIAGGRGKTLRAPEEAWRHYLLQLIREWYAKYGEPQPRPEPRRDRIHMPTFTPTTIYEVRHSGRAVLPLWVDEEANIRMFEEVRAHLENDEVMI
jgi:hypothetical protein